jgi:hypothetical protein
MESFNIPSILVFDQVQDIRGNLCFLENSINFPLKINNVSWVTDFKDFNTVNGYTYSSNKEIIINLTGICELSIKDSLSNITNYILNKPNTGIFIPFGYRRSIKNLSSDNLLIIISDKSY